eukprot:gene577-870_t
MREQAAVPAATSERKMAASSTESKARHASSCRVRRARQSLRGRAKAREWRRTLLQATLSDPNLAQEPPCETPVKGRSEILRLLLLKNVHAQRIQQMKYQRVLNKLSSVHGTAGQTSGCHRKEGNRELAGNALDKNAALVRNLCQAAGEGTQATPVPKPDPRVVHRLGAGDNKNDDGNGKGVDRSSADVLNAKRSKSPRTRFLARVLPPGRTSNRSDRQYASVAAQYVQALKGETESYTSFDASLPSTWPCNRPLTDTINDMRRKTQANVNALLTNCPELGDVASPYSCPIALKTPVVHENYCKVASSRFVLVRASERTRHFEKLRQRHFRMLQQEDEPLAKDWRVRGKQRIPSKSATVDCVASASVADGDASSIVGRAVEADAEQCYPPTASIESPTNATIDTWSEPEPQHSGDANLSSHAALDKPPLQPALSAANPKAAAAQLQESAAGPAACEGQRRQWSRLQVPGGDSCFHPYGDTALSEERARNGCPGGPPAGGGLDPRDNSHIPPQQANGQTLQALPSPQARPAGGADASTQKSAAAGTGRPAVLDARMFPATAKAQLEDDLLRIAVDEFFEPRMQPPSPFPQGMPCHAGEGGSLSALMASFDYDVDRALHAVKRRPATSIHKRHLNTASDSSSPARGEAARREPASKFDTYPLKGSLRDKRNPQRMVAIGTLVGRGAGEARPSLAIESCRPGRRASRASSRSPVEASASDMQDDVPLVPCEKQTSRALSECEDSAVPFFTVVPDDMDSSSSCA